jgi:hypothetical protein
MVEDEQGGVELGLSKFKSPEVRGEPAISSPGRLLQSVEILVKVVDPVMLRGIN